MLNVVLWPIKLTILIYLFIQLQVHGNDFKNLYKKVAPEKLPSFLGGTGPDLNFEKWNVEICSSKGEGEDTVM